MKTNRIVLLALLLLIICSLHATAQTDYYYYYGGQKMPLTLNEDKVVVNVPKDCAIISERIRATVQVLATMNGQTKGLSFDILTISRSEYEKLSSKDFWMEDVKSVILTSYYFTEEGVEVFTSPFVHVKLKKAEDTDFLTPYVDKNKLRNLGSFSQYLPLWYVLVLTPESEKSPLQCANELQESGFFEYAEPDLVSLTIPDGIHAQGITTTTPEESSRIFDLQGRRLTGKPTKGVYIEDGRKKTK